MADNFSYGYTCFDGHQCIASGSLATVILAAKRAVESGVSEPILIFDDATGRSIDVDTRGSDDEILARLNPPVAAVEPDEPVDESRGSWTTEVGCRRS